MNDRQQSAYLRCCVGHVSVFGHYKLQHSLKTPPETFFVFLISSVVLCLLAVYYKLVWKVPLQDMSTIYYKIVLDLCLNEQMACCIG